MAVEKVRSTIVPMKDGYWVLNMPFIARGPVVPDLLSDPFVFKAKYEERYLHGVVSDNLPNVVDSDYRILHGFLEEFEYQGLYDREVCGGFIGMMRGSLIKRDVLGFWDEYKEVNSFFARYGRENHTEMEENPMARAVCQSNGQKPTEIDVRVFLKKGEEQKTNEVVNDRFSYYKTRRGFTVEELAIGTADAPRSLYKIGFKRSGKRVLTVDFANFTYPDDLNYDLRINYGAGPFERFMTSGFYFDSKRNIVVVGPGYSDYLDFLKSDYLSDLAICGYASGIGNAVREIGSYVIFPGLWNLSKGGYEMMMFRLMDAFHTFDKEHAFYRRLVDYRRDETRGGQERALLIRRSSSIVGDCLLYECFDPFVTTERFLADMPEGTFPIHSFFEFEKDPNRKLWREVFKRMAARVLSRRSFKEVEGDEYGLIMAGSRAYKFYLPELCRRGDYKKSGMALLTDALSEMGLVDARKPLMSTCCRLFDPVAGWDENW